MGSSVTQWRGFLQGPLDKRGKQVPLSIPFGSPISSCLSFEKLSCFLFAVSVVLNNTELLRQPSVGRFCPGTGISRALNGVAENDGGREGGLISSIGSNGSIGLELQVRAINPVGTTTAVAIMAINEVKVLDTSVEQGAVQVVVVVVTVVVPTVVVIEIKVEVIVSVVVDVVVLVSVTVMNTVVVGTYCLCCNPIAGY